VWFKNIGANMFCGKCGKPLNINAPFCPSCGNSVSKNSTLTQNISFRNNSKIHTKKIIFIVVSIAVIAYIIIFYYSFIFDSDPLNGKYYEKYNSMGEIEYIIELGNEPPGMIIMDRSPNSASIIVPFKNNVLIGSGIYHFKGTYKYDKKTNSGILINDSLRHTASMHFTISDRNMILVDDTFGGTYFERR
jgi:hypothetical protein